jgi:AraC-like DNA-binding protein
MSTVFDLSFKKDWDRINVIKKEGFYTSVSDFHKHEFYELNLILSGNVNIIFPDVSEETCERRIVLSRPNTPHFITCKPDILYDRLYLLFTDDFFNSHLAEWKRFEKVFSKSGNILKIDAEQCELFKRIILLIKKENEEYRQKLLVLYLLSALCEISDNAQHTASTVPPYIINALSYIEAHYNEKLTAQALAKTLYTGRTTLMINFKKHIHCTLNEYITAVRLKNAVSLLLENKSEADVAELCGFSDSGSLIRSFKKQFELTPRQYIKEQTRQHEVNPKF